MQFKIKIVESGLRIRIFQVFLKSTFLFSLQDTLFFTLYLFSSRDSADENLSTRSMVHENLA